MRRILLTGIPGAGKTTIGRHLAREHGFEHLDFELPAHIERFLAGAHGLFEELGVVEKSRQNIVVSWGFIPEAQLRLVLALRRRGYEWIWLDGDRAAARQAFLTRGTTSESSLRIQMRAIREHVDLDRLQPRIVDPFDSDGAFRPVEDNAADVLRLHSSN